MINQRSTIVGFIENEGDNIDKIVHKGDEVFNQGYDARATGTNQLELKGTIGKNLKEFEIEGQLYQEWTPSPTPELGNNLLDNSKIEKGSTVSNLTYTDSSITYAALSVGSVINSAEIEADSTSYAYSFAGDTSKVTITVKCYNSSHTYIGDGNKLFDEVDRGVIITLVNTAYVRLFITSKVQGNIVLSSVMFNKGGQVKEFESYGFLPKTGPCEVKGVGDKTKNLLKLNDGEYGNNGLKKMLIDQFEINNCHITIKGTSRTQGGRNTKLSDIFTLKAGTYTMQTQGIKNVAAFLNKADNSVLASTGTFTINEDIQVYFGINLVSGTMYNDDFYIMLNTGSTALPYEPYGYKIPIICGGKTEIVYLPTPLVNGEILRSDGSRDVKWGVVKASDLKWTKRADSYDYTYMTAVNDISYNPDLFACNKYKVTRNIFTQMDDFSIRGTATGSSLCIRDSRFPNVDDFIESLKDCYIYYTIAIPTIEQVSIPLIPTFRDPDFTPAGATTNLLIDTELAPAATTVKYRSNQHNDPVLYATADNYIYATADGKLYSTQR